jgi:hypothetical protein
MLVHIDGVIKQPTKFSHLLQNKLELDSCLDPHALDQIYHANELQKTSFPPELARTLAKLYPGLLGLYQQLNLQADLCGDEIQAGSAASQYWSPLAHFAERLAPPISLPVQHSLLQLLLWLLAPEPTERVLAHFNRCTKEIQQKVDQLWLHAQHLDRLNGEQGQELGHLHRLKAEQEQELERLHRLKVEQEQELSRLQRINGEQSQTLDCLQWLNMEQIQELERQSVRIESLADELDSIHSTRIWKALQSYRNLKQRWKNAA